MTEVPISSFIALDCETTGLDPRSADVIEIALLKFENGIIADNILHLVKPGHPIPLRNQRLTGITDEMVKDSPSMDDIIDDVLQFIGNHPIVGHNITFDLKFLNHKLKQNGHRALSCPTYDTLRLAALLFPEESSLKLKVLADKFNIDFEESHRAWADAELSGKLLLKLQEHIAEIPAEVIQLLAGQRSESDNAIFKFLHLIAGFNEERVPKPETDILTELLCMDTKPVALEPGSCEPAVDLAATAAAAFGADGLMGSMIDGFELRQGQPEMALKFAEHIANGGYNAIEAGCGMGKSSAYLAPAVMAAGKGIRPIVVSTYTKNLQDQLADKDLPILAPLQPAGLKFTTLKGRNSYVCLSRMLDGDGRLYGAERLSAFERALLLSWLHSTREGDIDKINFFILNNFNNLKSHLNFLRAEGEFCNADECRWHERCFVRASRRRAAASDIVVTNHALFFAGFEPERKGPKILPEFKHVIFDEAHHLEDCIAQSISLTLDSYITVRVIDRFLKFLDSPEGGRNDAQIMHRIAPLLGRIKGGIEDIAIAGESMLRRMKTSGTDSYAPRLILTEETVNNPAWLGFCSQSASLLMSVAQCRKEIEEIIGEAGKGILATRLSGFAIFLDVVEQTIRRTLEPDLRSDAVWLDAPSTAKGARLRLNVWPLSVTARFQELVRTLDSCQFTSATLSALGDIRFFVSRLGFDPRDVDFSSYPAPFDMRNQARIFIPDDLEPPSAPDRRIWQGMREGYVETTAQALFKIIHRFGGHTLCLFTSTQDMDDVGETIRPMLEAEGISTLLQFRDGGKSALIEEFSIDPRTALLGTRSFFEGVDIPNDALKCLVLARLPFPHPEEPLHYSRLRQMAEEGIDGFTNLSLPLANLSLRQAAGRLIRTPYDKGVIIFLDNRIITKNYGEALMNGLESIPLESGPLDEIVETAAGFLEM